MRWISYELDYHRQNAYHRCTVLPDVEFWGVKPKDRPVGLKAKIQRVARLVSRKADKQPEAYSDPAVQHNLTRKYKTVWIEAWKYESGAALWAAFTKEIYSQAQGQLGGWSARLKFRLALANSVDPSEDGYSWGRVVWSVLKNKWFVGTTLVGGAGVAGVLALDVLGIIESSKFAAVSGLGTIAGWAGLIKGLFRQPFSFNLDKASAAAVNHPEPVDTVGAPNDIARMIHLLAHRKDEALVVFVDDLDRCSPDKVKEAVEAINLLFNGSRDSRTVFILGMDVDMVAASMQVAYRPMVTELRRLESQSAHDFGYRFLGKIVQLSLNIPPPARPALRSFLGGMIGAPAGTVDQASANQTSNGQTRTPGPGPTRVDSDGGRTIPDQTSKETPAERTARIEQTVVSGVTGLASNKLRLKVGDDLIRDAAPEEQAEIAEVLQKVVQRENLRNLTGDSEEVQKIMLDAADFLPDRPRDYIRFVNAVRLQLLVANQSLNFGSTDRATYEQIAKWTALGMRWPNLAAELRAQEGTLQGLEDWARRCHTKGTSGWKRNQDWESITTETAKSSGWSRRIVGLTYDPDFGPALLEEPSLGAANLNGLLSVL